MKKENKQFITIFIMPPIFLLMSISLYFIHNYSNNIKKEEVINKSLIKSTEIQLKEKKGKVIKLPLIKSTEITQKSTQNRDIKIYKLGSNTKNKIAFIGGVHGNEPQGVYIVNQLFKYVKDKPEILEKKELLFIPLVNPDGFSSGTRTNSNGVDINRNFPSKNWKQSSKKDNYYSGDKPESEIETQILKRFIDYFKPKLIINIHSPYKVVNYDGPALEIAKFISKKNGYPVSSNIGYPTLGSFGSYYGIDKKIAVITLETSVNSSEKEWNDNKEALIALIKEIDNLL